MHGGALGGGRSPDNKMRAEYLHLSLFTQPSLTPVKHYHTNAESAMNSTGERCRDASVSRVDLIYITQLGLISDHISSVP